MRQSEREVRPVDEVLQEWMHDCAARIEREERVAEEASARKLTTPAMQSVAFYADERECTPAPDLEEWDRSLPYGHVETALAQD